MESLVTPVLLGFGAAFAAWYLLLAHSVSVIARKTGQGDTAEILAYVPGLQILPIIWAGGGSAGRALIVYVALLFANFLLGVAAGKTGGGAAGAVAVVVTFALALLPTAYLGVISWRTAKARGLPGFVGALNLLTSFLIHPVIAFHDGWARPHRVGASLGVGLSLAILAPIAFFGDRIGQELAHAQSIMDDADVEISAESDFELGPSSIVGAIDAAEPAPMPDTVAVVDDEVAPGARAAEMPAEVAQDHDRSIRVLFALQARFDELTRLSTPEAIADPTRRARALDIARELRMELVARRGDLDAATHAELEHQLAMTVARIEGRAPTTEISGGGIRLANTEARERPTIGSAAPAAKARDRASAPTRPFPVQLSESCPAGTALVSRQADEGEEEWCQQHAHAGGLRHGWYARYFDDGRPEQVGEYRNGLRVGVWTRFYADGEIRAQAEFREGMQHGWLLSFDRDGKRQKALRFDRGNPAR